MGLALGAWRVLMAVKDGLVLLFLLLFFAVIYVILSAAPNAGAVREGALMLNLKGHIVETARVTSAQDAFSGNTGPHEFLVRDLVRALDAAATDDRVKAVVLDLSGFSGGGQVALERVGQALDLVREAKKPVLAYSGGYDDASYLLASHASEIWLEPMGLVALPGPGGSHLYYKGLIDKLGANVHVYRVGKYKSFVEPYTRADQSPDAKMANKELLKAIWGDWQANVARARPKAKLSDYINHPEAALATAQGNLAQAAINAKIVDQLATPYDFGDHVAKIVGSDDDRTPGGFRAIRLTDWLAANPASTSGTPIGVVTVAGEIVDGKSTGEQAGGDTIARQIEKAMANSRIKALVLRIDSPGGSVAASEKIRLALDQAKKAGLPVVASMGSVAASGGYWVSTPAAKVLAEPGTITGSIGVFGIIPTFEHSLAKLGVTHDGVATTPLSGQPDVFGGTTPELDRLIQSSIDATYQRFIGLVGAARGMPTTHVDDIAQGRVWGGEKAKELKLIDGYGTLDDALAEAARAAKLTPSDTHPIYLEEQPSWFASLLAGLNAPDEDANIDPVTRMARRQTGALSGSLIDAQRVLNGPVMQIRCIECPTPTPIIAKTGVFETFIWRLFGS